MSEIRTLGPVGLNPLGNYNSQTEYEKLDVVLYQGSSYVALKPAQGIVPTNAEYWQKLVSGGVGVDDIVDNLESSASDKPLSANMGKLLGGEVTTKLENNLKVHFLSSNNNIVNSNGLLGDNIVIEGNKIGIIDFGFDQSCNYLINFLREKNISKIDYMVITHYHGDHIGGLAAEGFTAFLNSEYFDFSNCKLFLPHKNIDWNSFLGTEVSRLRNAETTIKGAALSKGLEIVEPDNEDSFIIEDNTKIKFYNIGSNFYQEYYNEKLAWTLVDTENTNYNNFSMVTKLEHFNNVFLFTGDIETKAESMLYSYLGKVDVLKVEHHSLNRDSNYNYLGRLNPKISVITSLEVLKPNELVNNTIYNSYTKGSKIYQTRYEIVTVISSFTSIYSENSNLEIFNTNNNIFGGLAILSNSDLNDYDVEGSYSCISGTVAATLLNTPYVSSGFKLIVEKLTGTQSTFKQTLIPANTPYVQVYSRIFSSGTWQNWEVTKSSVLGKLSSDKLIKGATADITFEGTNTNVSFLNGIIIGNLMFTLNSDVAARNDILIIPTNLKMANSSTPQTYKSETTNFIMIDQTGNAYSGYIGRLGNGNLSIRCRQALTSGTTIYAQFVKAPELVELTLNN